MLELDIVLERFLMDRLSSLSDEEREAFKVLLECSDNDLWDLVCGRAEPDAGPQARIIERLRAL